MTQRFENTFAKLEKLNEGAFMPFVSLCDPNFDTSLEILKTVIDSGADALELGFPFSDPSADGPVIQQSDKRALNSGANTDDFFKTAYYRAQELILAEQKTRHAFSEMKTTAVSLVLHDNKAYWAHIGDSRLYIFKHNKVKFRTIDHSVPQMLALSGDIKESEIRKHPDRNRLLRVLGVKGEQPKYELGKTIRLSGIQAFLLCTDGFWELIDEESMEKLLKSSNTPDEWIEKMRKVILENGKNTEMDNFTAIAVFCDKGGWFW